MLIYAATVTAAIVGGSVALGVPLEWIAWLVLLVEAVPLATWGGAMLIRRMMRQPRQDWTHLGCDPVAPPLQAPTPRYHIEQSIEKEIDHVTVDFPRISSTPVGLLAAPANHRDGRTAD